MCESITGHFAEVQTSAKPSAQRVTFADLNGMAAETIMGWEATEPGRMYRHPDGLYLAPPAFATDMRETWALVEKLTAEGFQFALEDNVGIWEASFDASLVQRELDDEIFAQHALTPSLATLLAALKTRSIAVEREDISE